MIGPSIARRINCQRRDRAARRREDQPTGTGFDVAPQVGIALAPCPQSSGIDAQPIDQVITYSEVHHPAMPASANTTAPRLTRFCRFS